MDLAVIIIVNIIFLALIYFLFSIRLSRALEKSRQQGIPRQFYENIEMVIRYLDTTLETVSQNSKSFYHLVARADAIKNDLEKLIADYDTITNQTGKKRSKQTAAQKSKQTAEESKPAKTKITTATSKDIRVASVSSENQDDQTGIESPAEQLQRSDGWIDRLLADAGEDQFERQNQADTSPSALIGAKKDRPLNPATAGAGSMIAGIGRFTKRFFGLTQEQSDSMAALDHSRRLDSKNQSHSEAKSFKVEPVFNDSIVDNHQMNLEKPKFVPSQFESDFQKPLTDDDNFRIQLPDLSDDRERSLFIRSLLDQGMSTDEIVAITRSGAAEVEFIRTVMNHDRKKRSRHHDIGRSSANLSKGAN